MGKLIAFDGISSCGKGTQIELLSSMLNSKGYSVTITSWNSDKFISPIISEAKKLKILNNNVWSILHATDLLIRYNEIILPSLKADRIVIVDRYICTALTRDILRGSSKKYIKELYSFLDLPDLYFWIDIDVDIAYERRIERCNKLFYYSSGCDIYGENNYKASWLNYGLDQNRLYSEVAKEYALIRIDGNLDKEKISSKIWNKVEKIL